MKYYPRWVFEKAVSTYNADYHVRVPSSAMCRYLLIGQLSGCKSLNDISLVLKALWGYSKNAVQTQLWVAICAYLLLAWIKVELKSPLSVTEIATIVEVSILSKTDIGELIQAPESLTINQDVNELTIF